MNIIIAHIVAVMMWRRGYIVKIKNEAKLKYNGDGTYTALFVQDDRQILLNRGIINIKACSDNDGSYGTVTINGNHQSVPFEENEWDIIIKDPNIIL